MRWKLLLVASLLAAIVGAGATLGITLARGSANHPPAVDLTTAATLLIPLVVIVIASLFVYRHTARRRLLQAVLAGLSAALLTLAILLACSVLLTLH